jgi:Ca2+-binding RTX toxin-like protein
MSVSSAGDFNADGIDDFLISTPFTGNGRAPGGAYVLYGKTAGLGTLDLAALDASDGFFLQGTEDDRISGEQVSAAGDLNGDGFADVVVGAPRYSYPTYYGGMVYVVYGGDDRSGTVQLAELSGQEGFTLAGTGYDSWTGSTLAPVGDFNGDAIGDLIVGNTSGEAYLVFGKRGGLESSSIVSADGFTIQGAQFSGYRIDGAGDFNGDGLGDLIIGLPGDDTAASNAGRAVILLGKRRGFQDVDLSALDAEDGYFIQGDGAADQVGWTVSSVGDFNGDALDDIVTGTVEGHLYIVFGTNGDTSTIGLAGLDASAGLLITGTHLDSWTKLAAAGDVNGDGFDDVMITARSPQSQPGGQIFIVFGKANGSGPIDLDNLVESDGFAIQAGGNGEYVGKDMASAGDVNGDGCSDLLISTRSDADTKYLGTTYVIYGLTPDEAVTRTGTAAGQTLAGGAGDDRLDGRAGDDSLYGNGGIDVIIGGTGHDRLNGGLGDDRLTGGNGNDIYVLDSKLDRTTELAGGGVDTVRSNFNFTLRAEFEALELLGSGNLSGIGNGAANRIVGNRGDNFLDGRGGADRMSGGAGDDQFIVDVAEDVVTEKENGGTDTIKSAASFVLGANVENLILTGSAAIDAAGNAAANRLSGNSAANVIDGGEGADRMTGGAGNDRYVVDDAGDVIVEAANGGTDAVESSVSHRIAATVENLTLTGSSDIDGDGNAAANSIAGNAGANRLNGREGADTLAGGAGDDTYIVDHAGDSLVEALAAGTDRVNSTVSHTLGANFEILTLAGTAAIAGTGNALANAITGNAAANALRGDGGNDTLDGKAGGDSMHGGAGSDLYVVDHGRDAVTELAGAGIDTVESSVTHTLDANVERLVLTGAAAIGGVGNALANVLTGNAAANILNGGGGNDLMTGGAGDDTYVVDRTSDRVVELSAGGVDLVRSSASYVLADHVENLALTGGASASATGNALANQLTGNSGNNLLDGLGGSDSMAGGNGNDTYIVGGAGDIVIEAASGGVDRVMTSLSHSLSEGVEQLTLTGTANVDASGNSLANLLTGNGGRNRLDGRAGADRMVGAGGNDVYVVDHAGDQAVESAAGGVDLVESAASYTLGRELEQLTLTGNGSIDATGNAIANLLTGNNAANRMDGGVGVDTMSGGAGDDSYVVDNVGDRIVELQGRGFDTIESSVSYSVYGYVEQLTLVGTAAIDAKGNSLSNALTGNSADNLLDGGAGRDRLAGGDGNDTYIVDHADDVIVEAESQGTADLVKSIVSYQLSDHVEELVLGGSGAINGTGNGSDNRITGNAAANQIGGGGGNDSLLGGAGADTFRFDTALDSLANVDAILDFRVVDDTIRLNQGVFGTLPLGTLRASAFRAGDAAADADDRIVYDADSGRIFYDAEGSGVGAALLFATVTAGTALTNADFVIQG